MDTGLLCVQRRRLPADLVGGDVISLSQPAGGDQGSRVTREVSEESLMLPDGLMDQASVTSAHTCAPGEAVFKAKDSVPEKCA